MQNSGDNKLYTLLGPGYQEGGGYLSPYEGDQAIEIRSWVSKNLPEEACYRKQEAPGGAHMAGRNRDAVSSPQKVAREGGGTGGWRKSEWQ